MSNTLKCGYLLLPDSADWLSRFHVIEELGPDQDTSLTKIDILVANVLQQNPSHRFSCIRRSVVQCAGGKDKGNLTYHLYGFCVGNSSELFQGRCGVGSSGLIDSGEPSTAWILIEFDTIGFGAWKPPGLVAYAHTRAAREGWRNSKAGALSLYIPSPLVVVIMMDFSGGENMLYAV